MAFNDANAADPLVLVYILSFKIDLKAYKQSITSLFDFTQRLQRQIMKPQTENSSSLLLYLCLQYSTRQKPNKTLGKYIQITKAHTS